jgi:hypothetical protein
MGIKCFLLQPVERQCVGLRRYGEHTCVEYAPGQRHYHDALAWIATVPLARDEIGVEVCQTVYTLESCKDDARWPTVCERCGFIFRPEDHWQIFTLSLWARSDTGEEVTLRDAPPGAMWNAGWMPENWRGPDGLCLVVKLPNGSEWMIDGRASNCTLPTDTSHRCWVRHGEPPIVTVDKQGLTCAAGAGSIQSGNYHGFLISGEFQP